MVTTAAKVVLDADGVRRTLVRIAHEIVERNSDLSRVCLVGIYRRGVPLAQRLRLEIEAATGSSVSVGALDISFYRDDVAPRAGERRQPVVHATRLDFPIDDRTVVLVDDVLYTGRTIRAAVDALFDYGRPARIQLAVLADRGHRELPIRADYVGKNLPTGHSERVFVRLVEIDETDEVVIAGGAQ
jgi:pyrimidine operon attenuation protein / uracil phosphoribosyltransferase